jgi:hypothetical protein
MGLESEASTARAVYSARKPLTSTESRRACHKIKGLLKENARLALAGCTDLHHPRRA